MRLQADSCNQRGRIGSVWNFRIRNLFFANLILDFLHFYSKNIRRTRQLRIRISKTDTFILEIRCRPSNFPTKSTKNSDKKLVIWISYPSFSILLACRSCFPRQKSQIKQCILLVFILLCPEAATAHSPVPYGLTKSITPGRHSLYRCIVNSTSTTVTIRRLPSK